MAKEIESFIKKLDELINKAFDASEVHRMKGNDNGLAYYYLGRSISCLMGVKTLLFSLNHAGAQSDFANAYIQSLPDKFPRKDVSIAERYIKETHMAIRFVLFQNFYSQTEFTFRIIKREKYSTEQDNPFKLMGKVYGMFSDDESSFFNDIRNTIHNNGHYFPNHNTDKEYTFNGKQFKFSTGKVIDDVTMTDILAIVEFILDASIKLFEREDLATIKFE